MRLHRALIGTTLMATTWSAGTAQAADYGGGTPADSLRRAQRQLTMVGIRTAGDGTARIWVKVAARCGTGGMTDSVDLNPDGSFAVAGIVTSSIGNGIRRRTRITMSGRVIGATASGKVSARLTFRRRGRVTARCKSGSRTWQARVAAPQPTAAAPRPNGAYYGFTSQGAGRPFPFVLSVDARGQRVRTAIFDYRQRCKRKAYEFDNITPGARVGADGTFHLRERFTIHYSDGNERYRVAVDGRFTTSGVSGTLSVKSVLRARGGGRVLDRCATGATTFAAVL
jgi:hypothetical protein